MTDTSNVHRTTLYVHCTFLKEQSSHKVLI